MESKVWWKSKTIQLQALASVVAFLAVNLEPLKPYMTPEVFGIFVVAMGALNVVLRFITTQAIVTRKE